MEFKRQYNFSLTKFQPLTLLGKAVSNPMQDTGQVQQQAIITSTPNGQQVTVIPASSNVRSRSILGRIRMHLL